MSYPWLKFWKKSRSSTSIRRVANETDQPTALILGTWVHLLTYAEDTTGRLVIDGRPLELWLPAEDLKMDPDELDTIIKAMVADGCLIYEDGYLVAPRFKDYQSRARSPAEYQADYRQRKRETGNRDQPEPRSVTTNDNRSEDAANPGQAHDSIVPGDDQYPELESYFVQLTGLFPPQSKDIYTTHWLTPYQELLSLVNGDLTKAKELMAQAITKHQAKRLKYTRPSSIMTVARSLVEVQDLEKGWQVARRWLDQRIEWHQLPNEIKEAINRIPGGAYDLRQMAEGPAREAIFKAIGELKHEQNRRDLESGGPDR